LMIMNFMRIPFLVASCSRPCADPRHVRLL
jgi:hypothetical protein